ncbi:MAG: hypothetical protein KJP04_04145, partial [Arenicella sp.]|nr:hypothetical protein [Arenicella sp.]
MKKPRLAVVASHVIQHFAPVYKQLAKSGAIDLRVFFIAENGVMSYRDAGFGADVKWDVELTSGYPHEFVEPGKVIDNFSFFSIDSKNIVTAINRFAPDFIWLNGYASLANWRVLLDQDETVKFIYGSDSNPDDARSAVARWVKAPVVKFFLKRCHYFLSISPANKKYLQSYGVQSNAISDSKYPVDIERLKVQREQLDADQVNHLRDQLKIPPRAIVAVFAGKLIAHKRPQDVLQVLIQPGLGAVHAVLMGSGDMSQALQKQAKSLGIENRV